MKTIEIRELRRGIAGFIIIACFMAAMFNFSLLRATAPASPENTDYAGLPPFMLDQNQLLPNLLLIFDNSQYMGFPAYCKNVEVGADGIERMVPGGAYNSAARYVGFYRNDRYYYYTRPQNAYRWVDTGIPTTSPRPANTLPGNFLNWATMTKWDVLKVVTVGGPVTNLGGGNDAEAVGETRAINPATGGVMSWTCATTAVANGDGTSVNYTVSVSYTNNGTQMVISPPIETIATYPYAAIPSTTKFAAAPPASPKSPLLAALDSVPSLISVAEAAAPPAPNITAITDSAGTLISNATTTGSVLQGTAIRIVGTNFGATCNDANNYLSIGGKIPCWSISSWSNTLITYTVAYSVPVGIDNVLVQGGNTLQMEVRAGPPIIWGLYDWDHTTGGFTFLTSSTAGRGILVWGTNFGTVPGTVTFNGTVATSIWTWTNGYVIAGVPEGATTGNVVVRTPGAAGLSSNGMSLTITTMGPAEPTITGIAPQSGGRASEILITGVNFGVQDVNSQILFRGIYPSTASAYVPAADIVSWTDTAIRVRVPDAAPYYDKNIIVFRDTPVKQSNPWLFYVTATSTSSRHTVATYWPNFNPYGVVQELFMNGYTTTSPTWKTNVPLPGFLSYDAVLKCMNTAPNPSLFINTMRHVRLTDASPNAALYNTYSKAIDYFKALNTLGCDDPLQASRWCLKNFVLFVGSGKSDEPAYLGGQPLIGADGTTPNATLMNSLRDLVQPSHVNDIRSDIANTQVISFYNVSVSAADPRREFLKNVSKYGGFSDNNTNNQWDSGEDTGNGNRDNSNNIIPDTYFEPIGNTENSLRDAIIRAVTEIMRRATSGTAVSVLATSAEGEGALFQAYFRPNHYEGGREVRWLGYLNGMFVDPYGNIREDTNQDGKLVLTQDKIVRLVYNSATGDTEVKRYQDTTGTGEADMGTEETVAMADLKVLWEAGKNLANKDYTTRTLYTSLNGKTRSLLTDATANDLLTTTSATMLPGITAADVIDFTKGRDFSSDATKNYRDRRVTVSGTARIWKLGDIVYSTPTVVSAPAENYDLIYGDSSYLAYYSAKKDRKAMVYAGSNDGMLHAFYAGTFHQGDNPSTTDKEYGWFTNSTSDDSYDPANVVGNELWSYIPRSFLPHLQWNMKRDYQHVFGVDLKVKVADVKIFTPDTNHVQGWGTVLIGGMRMGGGPITDLGGTTKYPTYFALDITNPDDPQLLWEFTHTTDMGLTLSYPCVVKKGTDWYALFGSGPDFTPRDLNGYQGISTRNAKFFAVNIATYDPVTDPLANMTVIDTGYPNSFVGNPVSLDVDLDFNTDVVYSTLVKGNAVAVNNTVPNQAGVLYRIETTSSSPASWVKCTVFTSAAGAQLLQPPSLTVRGSDLWIFFASGRFLHVNDKATTTQQYLYGLRDPGYSPTSFISCTSLTIGNLFNSTAVQIRSDTGAVEGAGTVTTFDALKAAVSNTATSKFGWYFALPTTAERGVAKASVIGDVVLFTTYIPTNDVCTSGGSGNLYALYSVTGSAYLTPLIGTTGSYNSKVLALGAGTPSSVSIHMGREKGGKAYIQQSTGAISNIDFLTAARAKSGFVLWREKW